MKIQRIGQLAGIALVGALALSACGSDNNTAGAAAPPPAARLRRADCSNGTLNAEGSSAQKNAIEEAITAFQDACEDATVNYNPTGSGAGIKQFIAGQVDFAGSDSALKTDEKDGKIETAEAEKSCGSPAWNLPMVTGPIAVAYNVKGVDKLVLTPEVTAKIFNGKITTWNDPAIAALNSGVTLPADPDQGLLPLRRVGHHRELHQVPQGRRPDAWTAEPGKKWTGKGEGKEKSAGVASAVQGHRRRHHLRRVVLRQAEQAGHRPDRQRRAARSS